MIQYEITKQTPLHPFQRHWQFCVGSGHATLALRADYCAQLRQVHDDLGMERVRFHGIFCDDMHTMHTLEEVFPFPVETGITETSFRQCAVAYDNLLAAGMKPFVELSFMPKRLAKEDHRGMFFYKPNICMPKDDQAWIDYIQSFVRFLLDRYGAEEVETWYFEVWNEPDLPLPFFHGTKEEYFHLYEITARAIKEIDDKIQVGGPSTSGSKWVASFVKFCEEHDVPVDFITTHQYAGDPLGGISDEGGPGESEEPEMDPEAIKEQMKNIDPNAIQQMFTGLPKDAILPALRRFMGDPLETDDIPDNVFRTNAPIVKQQAGDLPVFYTEWNNCATFSAYGNDTRKVAAYDVKTILALENVIDGSSIWCFSDIFEELHPFPEEFHGGFGLMTQSGIKKPVYYALEMMANVGDMRYDLGDAIDNEVGMAAFSGDDEIQCILFRQKMKNNLDLPKEEVSISLELDAAPSQVILERIDEEHCNPLRAWEEMGSPQVPTPKQVEQLKEISAMRQETLPFSYQDGKLTLSAALGINDVYCIRVVK